MLFELILEVVVEIIFAFGGEGLVHSMRKERYANPLLAALGYALLGGLAGALGLLILPQRVFPIVGVRGISLILAPIATGLLMKTYGDFRRRHGHTTSGLATFWGGAIFAFSMALVRFLAYGSRLNTV